VLRALALLFAFRGIGNLLKRFGTGSGLVVFGHLLPQDTLLAPVLGTLMLIYAYGLWREAGWAVPLGIAYAVFASANLILFPVFTAMPPAITPWMYGIYVVGGIAMTWGAVWLLRQVRASR
jgi:hypothetical protein